MTMLLQGAGLQAVAVSHDTPHFASAEVGTVNASTVAVTFDRNVDASGSNYSSGVTIKVNGSTRSFESGIRQANHALVYYALASPAQFGDTVTWEYNAAAGSIVAESDGAPLADVTAQTVTNNIVGGPPTVASAVLLLDLRAKQLTLNDGDPVSMWADASGLGHDFTQTGTARPTYRAGGGVPYVDFDGTNDFIIGQNWIDLDNLDSFAVFSVTVRHSDTVSAVSQIIGKLDNYNTGQGWSVIDVSNFYISLIGGNDYSQWMANASSEIGQKRVYTIVKVSNNEAHVYKEGIEDTIRFDGGTVPIATFTNTDPVQIGRMTGSGTTWNGGIYALLVYRITDLINWPTDRAAIEAWLAANT